MDTEHDRDKVAELETALLACETAVQLEELGRGIAFLPAAVLNDQGRNHLRDVYIACARQLNGKGKKNGRIPVSQAALTNTAVQGSKQMPSVGQDASGKDEGLPLFGADVAWKADTSMRCKVIKIQEDISPVTKEVFVWVFFKMDTGKSAKTCLVPKYKNYAKWRPVIDAFNGGKEVRLSNVAWLRGKVGHIDADSPIIIE